jgi:hypothetical protein
MSAQMKVKARCPVCHTAYQLPGSLVGHRARCPKCDSVFRVLVPGASQATEKPPQTPGSESVRPAESATQTPREGAPPRSDDAKLRLHRQRGPGHPTDDDIVNWLMEGSDADDLPSGPRRWESPPAQPVPPAEQAAPPPARKASA